MEAEDEPTVAPYEGEDSEDEDEDPVGDSDEEEDTDEDDEPSEEEIDKIADLVVQKIKDKADDEEEEEKEPDATEAEGGKEEKVEVYDKIKSHKIINNVEAALRQVSTFSEESQIVERYKQ